MAPGLRGCAADSVASGTLRQGVLRVFHGVEKRFSSCDRQWDSGAGVSPGHRVAAFEHVEGAAKRHFAIDDREERTLRLNGGGADGFA